MDSLAILRETFGDRLREQEPMSRHTNFRIGGPARYFVDVVTPEEIDLVVRVAREAGLPWFIIGGGSNSLVADAGFNGFVIRMANRDIRIDGTKVIAGAGAVTSVVARAASEAGLTGFEWAVSLPGTIGGAVRGNAGCFGSETKDVVVCVSVLEITNDQAPDSKQILSTNIQTFLNSDCLFRYRHSIFKDHPEWIIIEVTLQLAPGDPARSRAQMDDYLSRRRAKQPLERPSAGCLFKNIEERDLTAEQLKHLDRVTAGEWRRVAHDGQIPSGWLIERAGCKGLRVGDAMVSEQHGNFVINLGHATAADVIAVSDAVRARIREQFGLELYEEVQRLGF